MAFEREKPLKNNEAQEEANMIKIIAEKGKENSENKELTAEDYDEALRELETLESLVQENSTSLNKIARTGNHLRELLSSGMDRGGQVVSAIEEGVYKAIEAGFKGVKEGWKEEGKNIAANREQANEVFSGPRQQLEALRKQAKEKSGK